MTTSVAAELESHAGGRTRRFVVRLRRVLTADHFPVTERVVKRLLWNPAGAMLLAAIVSLLCGVLLSPHALVLFAGLVTVLGVGAVWPWVSLRGLSAGFAFDRPRCREGETVGVSLTVTRRVRWAVSGLAVRGGFEPHDDANTVVAALPVVPGRRSTTVRWSFTPSRRGAYPLTPPRIVTGYPFGLRECGRVVTAAEPLVVWPKTYPVGALPDIAGDSQLEGCVSRSKAGQAGDVLGVRPYRRGDSPRRVHWAQTARHDRLVVCELQSNARPRVQVVLDADPESHRGTGPESSREWAVRVAASLVEGWLAQGAEVEAVIGGLLYPTSAGTPHLRKILDALAALPAGGPRLADTLAAPACRNFDGVQVVVTTDRGMAAAEARANRLFFALHADGFLADPCDATNPVVLPARPWVFVAAPGHVRHALRCGWKEANHGG
jgi:uncharacterized protein (DUF58 family)